MISLDEHTLREAIAALAEGTFARRAFDQVVTSYEREHLFERG